MEAGLQLRPRSNNTITLVLHNPMELITQLELGLLSPNAQSKELQGFHLPQSIRDQGIQDFF